MNTYSDKTGNPFKKGHNYGEDNYLNDQRNYNQCQWENQRYNNFTKFRDHQKTARNQNRNRGKQSYNRNYDYQRENTRKVFDDSNEKAPESDVNNKTNQSFNSKFDSLSTPGTPAITSQQNTTSSASTTVLNIKKDNIGQVKLPQSTPMKPTINQPVAKISSSSSDSSSDSDESIVKNLKDEYKKNSKSDNSKLGTHIKSEKEVKNDTKIAKSKPIETSNTITKELPKLEKTSSKTISKPNTRSSTDSESSDSTDEEASKVKKAKIKEKSPSEEDVICLGVVENFENLVDDDDKCLLCDKKGHTSFFCQTICRNCGKKYHNFKSCPKPANISIVLQQFMEFFMKQICNYNPDEQFESMFPSSSDIHVKPKNSCSTPKQAHELSISDSDSSSGKRNTRRRKHERSLKKTKNSNANRCQSKPIQFIPAIPLNYNSSIRSAYSSDSDSENSNIKRRKIAKHSKKNDTDHSLFPSAQMAFIPPAAFNQNIPFGFGTSNLSFNPMIAFKQMMGFNPALNFTTNSDKEK